ncbi:hypothetical protein KI387_004901, partial [Taxus chinensis]
VVNHGIPVELIEETLETCRVFFEYPTKEKMKVRGGVSVPQQMPTGYNVYPPGSWDLFMIERLIEYLGKTTDLIESLISQSLGLGGDFIKELNRDKIEPLKVLCYPKAITEEEIRAWQHQDSRCITLVGQDDTGGYQVLKDAKWVDIKPTKGALVINVGDINGVGTAI